MLFYLHRRNIRKQNGEDKTDPHKSLDFGMLMDPGKKSKQKNAFYGAEKEMGTAGGRPRQLSMDMDVSSPYLLPVGLQGSRESLHSLARTLHQNEDPYRPVANYAASDVGSLRKELRDGSSIHTGSSGQDSGKPRSFGSTTALIPPPRQNSLPKTPTPSSPKSPPPAHIHRDVTGSPVTTSSPLAQSRFVTMEPTIPVIETVPYPEDNMHAQTQGFSMPDVQEPPPVAQKVPRKGLPVSPTPRSREGSLASDSQPPAAPRQTSETFMLPDAIPAPLQPLTFPTFGDLDPEPEHEPLNPGFQSPQSQAASLHMSPPQINATPAGPHDHEQQPTIPQPPFSVPIVEEPHAYYEDNNYHPQQSHHHDAHVQYDDYDARGRSLHRRQSSEYPQDMPQAGNLNVQQFDTRRMSVGFRPLPPDEMMDTEDPEARANRIRSFYKEYFEDAKADPVAFQQQQQQHQQQQQQHQQQYQQPHHQQQFGNMQYYEDYDEQYMSETAFFDPESNAFVMPYSQPVARRAMTPPPSGSRFPGPKPPRGMHGSVGGLSLPGGRGPASRPGSSVSSRYGPRPGSSASNRYGTPRAGSAMSGRPRKPMPPPQALTTLPTPSKLKDDSFALMGAVEFAPPSTIRDQAAGRSQSPLGERRPYQMKVPASSPLVSSYDDMAALPSP